MECLRLPNNGARYSKKRRRETDYCPYFCSYIAWHGDEDEKTKNVYKPPNNVYCKTNRTNHMERTIVLRKEMERSQRRKTETANDTKTKIKQRRISRKRRRPPLSSRDGRNGSSTSNKRIRRQMASERIKQNRNDDRLKALMSEARDSSPRHNGMARGSGMDLWDQINSVPKHTPGPSGKMY